MSAADFEPNDTSSQAASIEGGSYKISGTGTDWFKFEADPGTVTVTMTPTDGMDINMVLYNSSLQVIGSDFSSGTEQIQVSSSSTATFYVELYPTVYDSAGYTLTVDLPDTGTWTKTLDFGPVRDVSVALYDIDSDGEDEIFIGTSKGLDDGLNEIRPAGLICLEADGTVKWSVSFPAVSGTDSQTGISYATTSVSTAPAFGDINGDGRIDIVVGVGADTFGEAGSDVSGQPGDKGGVYALDGNGSILWFHESLDVIGGWDNTGDGRPDGVYSSPVIFDVDQDGSKEIIYGGWDQSLWILDGATGLPELDVHLADTIWATPRVVDLNGDGSFEILMPADITDNLDAITQTGGIFHVISADGSQNISGFDQPVGNANYTELRGKFEEQVLWSSPQAADIDNDGFLEIIYGTGNYFHDSRGSYIRVWEHNGDLKFRLDTLGRTFASPLVADLDNDGDLEIVAATLDGYLYCWDHNGTQVFAVQPRTYPSVTGNPIFSAPVAADLNGDGYLEIIFSQGAQLVIVDHLGTQITPGDEALYVFNLFKGSPAVKDIDGDGRIDLISGGNTGAKDQAVVYRWASPFDISVSEPRYGRYQFHQSDANIREFVGRFYRVVLGRRADSYGLNYWADSLNTGVRAGADVATGFIFSPEFIGRGLDNAGFLDVLYTAFFNREPDAGGYSGWIEKLETGSSREEVLNGFIYSREFFNLCLFYGILPIK